MQERSSAPARATGEQPAARKQGAHRRLPWLVVGVLLVVVKTEAYASLFTHRATGIVLASMILVLAALRARVFAIVAAGSALFALLLHPTLGSGFAVAIGTFAVLATLLTVVALLLDRRAVRRRARLGPD